jgi:hypothetical protein
LSFIGILGRAKAHLREQGRLSVRALQREFELDDATLDEIVEELVDVQRVATREGRVLSWIGPASGEDLAAPGLQTAPRRLDRSLAAARS